MRIVIAVILFIVAFSLDSKSQDILLLPTQTGDSTKPRDNAFIVIKGDEIRRFPSADFMEAVNGFFPWAFSQYHDPNEFLFVVNGFVLPDINSISLNDIDEIIFTRNNLYGTLFPFSRAGTFLITTKRAKENKLQINLNSQYNTTWNNGYLPGTAFGLMNSIQPSSNKSNNKAGHYLSNHVSLAFAGKKINVYFSAQANGEKSPEIRQYTIFHIGGAFADTINSTSVTNHTDQRAFLDITYKFSKKLEAGIMADYSHHGFNHPFDYHTVYNYFNTIVSSKLKTSLNYYHVAAFMNYRVSKNLLNTLWFEHGFEKMDWDYSRNTDYVTQPLHFTGTSEVNSKNKSYLVRDQLLYNLSSKGKFTSDLSLTFAYLRENLSTESFSQSGPSWSSYIMSVKEKIATLNPLFNFSWQHFISGYFGASFLVGKKEFKYVEEKDKTSLYSGIEMNFARFIKNKKNISTLILSANYGDLPKNNSNNYWANPFYLANSLFPRSRFEASSANYNPFQPGDLTLSRNKLLSFRLSSAFLYQRFKLIAEWSQLKTDNIYSLYVSGGYYIPARGIETTEGLSVAFSGKIIDNSKVKFKSTFNLLFPKTKLDQIGTLVGATPYRSSVRSGLQNRLDYKNFFFQVNALADINHVYYIYSNTSGSRPVAEKHSDFNINYVLLGYEPKLIKRSPFTDMSVFLQVRNLFVSKKLREAYEFDHYGGIGVNLYF
jgi:hypothetical protein